MNDLITQTQQLPDTLEDLSKFVLVGREKLVSVRAEIKAIDKLHLAEEVRNQKKEEALMLSEALLDAEVRLGDLLKEIPNHQGVRHDLQLRVTADPKLKEQETKGAADPSFSDLQLRLTGEPKLNEEKTRDTADTGFRSPKTKAQIIEELGFERNQAQRFETLASNKDVVEQVKQEARENDDIPTRSRVLDLVGAKKKRQAAEQQSASEYSEYLNGCRRYIGKLRDATYGLNLIPLGHEELDKLKELIGGDEKSWIEIIEEDIEKLQILLKFLKGRCK